MRKDYDIVGSYNNQRVSSIDAERTVNCFEYVDKNGKRPKSLIFTSGLLNSGLNFTPETGGSRATFVYKDVIYQVFGGSVYRIVGNTGSLEQSKIGSLLTDSGYVGIDANTNQVIFVDGQQGYIWDITTSLFKQITDPAFPTKPIDACFLDGYFVVANGDTDQFQLSAFNQGLLWGPDNTGTQTALQLTNGNPDIQITAFGVGASINNYQVGTPVVFSAITTPGSGFVVATTYYVISVVDTTHVRLSATNGGTLITPAVTTTASFTNNGQLQQGSITSHPGNIVACRTLHRRLFLFSSFYTEVWENAGIGTNLPFRRNNSLLMEYGTPAIGSVMVGFDRMFFLSQSRDGLGSVMEVVGTEARPVSNQALDYQLAQYASDATDGITHVADCRGILVKENGLIFYRMNFTRANHTFVLNVTFSTTDDLKWHEEEILNGNRHPAQTHAFYKGVNYYASYNSAKFYVVDNSYPNNDGEPIRRMRIGKAFAPEGYNRLRIDRFHLDLLQGNVDQEVLEEAFLEAENNDDLLTEDGELLLLDQQVIVDSGEPVVFFSYSKDGGQTYGHILQAPMGQIGERTFRTVWRKLGTIPRGQSFVPKIEFFNQVPFVVLGAAWDFEILPE